MSQVSKEGVCAGSGLQRPIVSVSTFAHNCVHSCMWQYQEYVCMWHVRVCCCSSWCLNACFFPDVISHLPGPRTCSGEYLSLSQQGVGVKGWEHLFSTYYVSAPVPPSGGWGWRALPVLLWLAGDCAILAGRVGSFLPPWH